MCFNLQYRQYDDTGLFDYNVTKFYIEKNQILLQIKVKVGNLKKSENTQELLIKKDSDTDKSIAGAMVLFDMPSPSTDYVLYDVKSNWSKLNERTRGETFHNFDHYCKVLLVKTTDSIINIHIIKSGINKEVFCNENLFPEMKHYLNLLEIKTNSQEPSYISYIVENNMYHLLTRINYNEAKTIKEIKEDILDEISSHELTINNLRISICINDSKSGNVWYGLNDNDTFPKSVYTKLKESINHISTYLLLCEFVNDPVQKDNQVLNGNNIIVKLVTLCEETNKIINYNEMRLMDNKVSTLKQAIQNISYPFRLVKRNNNMNNWYLLQDNDILNYYDIVAILNNNVDINSLSNADEMYCENYKQDNMEID